MTKPDQGDPMELSPRQQEVKDEFVRTRGTSGESWEAMLRLDADFLDTYTELSAVPWRKNHLDPKIKELVYIAMDAAATHMFLPGVRQHVRAAISHGATEAELAEVLALISTLGIHAANIGVPILMEVLAERGEGELPPLDAEQERMKADFTEKRGYWHEFWNGLLALDPELFSAYLRFSSHPWEHGVLEPKVKEYVYIAFDAAATHLYEPGLKLHIRNALNHGATVAELMEVLEIVSCLGIHATASAPIIVEELDAAKAGDQVGTPT